MRHHREVGRVDRHPRLFDRGADLVQLRRWAHHAPQFTVVGECRDVRGHEVLELGLRKASRRGRTHRFARPFLEDLYLPSTKKACEGMHDF